VVFFVVFTLASLVSGLSGLSFLEVVSKTVPPRRRGEFFAWRFGLGGLLGVGGSLLVRWLLDPDGPLAFPYNFGLLAGLYFLFASTSLLLYNQVVEPADPQVQPRVSIGVQSRRAWEVLIGSSAFRRYIALQSALLLAGSATPFFAVYVQRELGGPVEMVGVYLGVTLLVSLLGNLVFGRVSYRRGNPGVMLMASLIGLGMSAAVLALALLARPLGISGMAASYALIPVFILSSLRNTAMGVSSNSLLLDLAPSHDRSVYIGFTNTLLGVVLLLSGASGVVFGLLGFTGLILLAMAAHAAAVWTSIRIGKG